MTSSERVSKTIRVYEDLHNAVKEETSGTPVSIADFYQVALEDALQTYDVERGRLVKTRPPSDETASKNNSEAITPDDNSDDDFDDDSPETGDGEDADVVGSGEDESDIVPADRSTEWYESLDVGHDYTLARDEHDWTDLMKSREYRLPVVEGLIRNMGDRVEKSDVLDLIEREMGMSGQSARNYWDDILRRDNGIIPAPFADPRFEDRRDHVRCRLAARFDDDVEGGDDWVIAGDTRGLTDTQQERYPDSWRGLFGAKNYRNLGAEVVFTDVSTYQIHVVNMMKDMVSAAEINENESRQSKVDMSMAERRWAAYYTLCEYISEVLSEYVSDDTWQELLHGLKTAFSAGDYEEYLSALGRVKREIGMVDVDVADAVDRLGLDVDEVSEVTEEDVREAYEETVKEVHPDSGGDVEDMTEVQEAREVLLEKV